MKRILLLGSGYISGCLVNFLTRVCPTTSKQKYYLTVASNIPKEVQDLASKFPHLEQTVLINVLVEIEKLHQLVSKSDLVISLLPNHMHLPVAQACIAFRVNMLHASYNTAELNALDKFAKQNGVLILGELGLDPGIDHLLAMKCIHEIQEGKGKITSFISYCGGLPAPEFADDNPLHYKFSWSPKTALGNLLNGAKFMQNKSIIEIPPGGQILDEVKLVPFLPELGHLEAYPNRNCLPYLEKYGLISSSTKSTTTATDKVNSSSHTSVKTMFRGTLRYAGFCSAVKTLVKLGLLEGETLDILDPARDHSPLSWRQFICHLVNNLDDEAGFRRVLSKDDMDTLLGLGLYSDSLVDKLGSPLDTLAKQLERTLMFKNGEQDVVILHHELEAKYPILSSPEAVCGRKEFREIDFVVYGDPSMDEETNTENKDKGYGYSAMAKTVAYTLGIAAQMMLNGEINRTGVILPVTKDIYLPILERLANYGLFAIERISEK